MTQERTDEDVVRAGIALAFLDTDPRIQPALAALDRLVARNAGSDELHTLRANAERVLTEERDRLLARNGELERALKRIAEDDGDSSWNDLQNIARDLFPPATLPEEPEGAE